MFGLPPLHCSSTDLEGFCKFVEDKGKGGCIGYGIGSLDSLYKYGKRLLRNKMGSGPGTIAEVKI